MSEHSIDVSDHYTGTLEGRRTGQRMTSGAARITKISVGEMDNNVYLIESLEDGKSFLIDAANDAGELVAFLRQAAPELDRVLTTHQHADHWIGLADTARELGLTTLAGEVDSSGIDVPTDVTVKHGDTIEVGALRLEAIGLRGHTPEGIALVLRTDDGVHLFSGDSLFPGGPGKTDSEQAFTTLMDDLESRVFDSLPDATVVHPGHGADTTLGTERPRLSAWRERGW